MTIIHRCAKDSFGLKWDEEMDKGTREQGHITLDMFLKAKEATKPEVKSDVIKVVDKLVKLKIESRKYEAPQLPSKSKFNYKNDFIERERNLANRGVKPFYNKKKKYLVYEKQVSVLIMEHQSLIVKEKEKK